MNRQDKTIEGESFILEHEPLLHDERLPDGEYEFAFCFTAPHNDAAISEVVHAVLEGDNFTLTIKKE